MSEGFRDVEAEVLGRLSVAERAAFDAAAEDVEVRLQVAELVYAARAGAGLSQAALGAKVGVRQEVISAIETGVQVPSVALLARIASASGRKLRIEFLDGR